MPARRCLGPASAVLLLTASLATAPRAAALTTSYDDSDPLLQYSPPSAWSEVSGQGFVGGAAREVRGEEASLAFAFAGEQVSLYGASSAAFTVELDGTATDVAAVDELDAPTRIFLASNLDAAATHKVVLRTTGDGMLRLDRVAVAYSNASGLTPALVAVAPESVTSSSASSEPSPASISPPPAASSSIGAIMETKRDSAGPGAIAGAVISSLLGVALIVFVAVFCLRRRNSRAADDRDSSSYLNAETGRRKSRASSFLAGLGGGGGTSRVSPIPLSTSGLTPPLHNGSAADVTSGEGGRSTHPHGPGPHASTTQLAVPLSHSPTSSVAGSVPASRTWAQRLARASSWRRKASRLPETQRFYGVSPSAARVGGAGLPPDPPPARPLPSVPPREMRERWREGPAPLVQGSGRWESPRASEEVRGTEPPVQQAYGMAVVDYVAPVEASPVTHPIAATHLRKRSVPRASSSTDAPRPPPAALNAAAPLSPGSFRNPFESTRAAAPPPALSLAHAPHASLDSTSAGSQWTSSSARASSDIAGARIAHARPVVALQEHPQEEEDDDDVPLYRAGAGAIPLRMGSLRELHETCRAGPRGETSTSVGGEGNLARRPTLTLREGNGADEREAAHAAGFEMEREDAGAHQDQQQGGRAARHRSAAALVEVVEELRLDELVVVDAAELERSTRDPPPGEEDRPAFFSKRERVPRYGVDRDPRLGPKSSR